MYYNDPLVEQLRSLHKLCYTNERIKENTRDNFTLQEFFPHENNLLDSYVLQFFVNPATQSSYCAVYSYQNRKAITDQQKIQQVLEQRRQKFQQIKEQTTNSGIAKLLDACIVQMQSPNIDRYGKCAVFISHGIEMDISISYSNTANKDMERKAKNNRV